MPYEWRIDHARRVVVARGSGRGTTADTLTLVEEVGPMMRACPGYDFLYDAIELRIESAPADMIRVANALFGDAGARFRRFAIVVPEARAALGRIFAALADPYGVVANVFGDVESARDWLAMDRTGLKSSRVTPPPTQSPGA